MVLSEWVTILSQDPGNTRSNDLGRNFMSTTTSPKPARGHSNTDQHTLYLPIAVSMLQRLLTTMLKVSPKAKFRDDTSSSLRYHKRRFIARCAGDGLLVFVSGRRYSRVLILHDGEEIVG
jgi:hypothetical protein